MSIFDEEDQMKSVDGTVEHSIYKANKLSGLLVAGVVKCAIYAPESNIISEKIHDIYGVPVHEASFASYIQNELNSACHNLVKHKHRKVFPLNCQLLKKGDALRFMKTLSKEDDDLIVVIENVTRIPEGDPNIYDARQYVENLLIRSWKNDDIYFDDSHISRRNLSIILTCPPEDKEKLMIECSQCSYAWVGDIEKIIAEKINNQ